MANRIVGLEIGPEFIRAVQLKFSSFGKTVIEKLVDYPISGGLDSNGKIINPELVSQHLKKLWKAKKFDTKHVALGLGGTDVFVREFTVPEMKPEALKGSLSALAEGSLPMPTTELFLDFYPAKAVQLGDSRSVAGLLLAATRTATESLVGVVQTAGLMPDSVDLIPFSLLRQLTDEKHKGQVVAIVHASSGYLNIVVSKDRVPIFIRMVPLPALKPFREESISKNSTETPLEEEDMQAQDETSPSEYLEANTTEIMTVQGDALVSSEFQDAAIRELKDTLTYYGRNHPSDPISTLLTSGEGLDNSEWLTVLGQQIWLPSESHTLSEDYKSSSGKIKRISVPNQFLVALSMAKGARRA